jgi:glycerol kinase
MAKIQCVLALDQGTTSSRTIAFSTDGEALFVSQREFAQHYPRPGWVEHSALDILNTQQATLADAVSWARESGVELLGVGVTNQRETVVLWEAATGKPLANAIVWQDRRTTEFCEKLAADKNSDYIVSETGLKLDPYFSASKINWLLQDPGIRARAKRGELLCGTIDSWIIWNLSGGTHITDPSNASRTMLFSLNKRDWDEKLLDIFEIPRKVLPKVVSSSGQLATISVGEGAGLHILSCIGDQQAALFGQGCVDIGMAKNTYGTGCFLLQNIGAVPRISKNGLLTTVAWSLDGHYTFALEGAVFIAGALVQWLRDGLQIISKSREIEALAASVDDSGGVVLVPAFAGLGAPDWDARARGLIIGITRGTTKAHIARAAEEAIAFQVADLLKAMNLDSGIAATELRVDGGGSNDSLLMQLQADVSGVRVIRPKVSEATAFGAALLALRALGIQPNFSAENQSFAPRSGEWIKSQKGRWREAVSRCKAWA